MIKWTVETAFKRLTLTMPGAMTEDFYKRNGFIYNEKMILMSKRLEKEWWMYIKIMY